MAAKFEVFFSYAHANEAWRKKLEQHLSSLKREKLISGWHDRMITPGSEWAPAIDTHLTTAHIILLLVSPDFISSDYCWGVELKKAIRRHRAGEACVIPIIVRPVDWHKTPFAKLQALPTDGKPISTSPNIDEALLQVAQGIRGAITDLRKKNSTSTSQPNPSTPTPASKTHNNKTTSPTTSRLWNIPFRRNPFFTGREEILTHIHTLLHADHTTALTQAHSIAGLGGIGKTQTAIEYAYRYQEEYQVVLWVKANTREELIADFIAIAALLNLPEKHAKDQAIVIQAVKLWLETHTGWLLIFDNADDIAMVSDYLPGGNKGHTLLTSRAQATGGIARKVAIDNMPTEEGAVFLLRRAALIAPEATIDSASPADQTTAREIVQFMDGLPLALDQAGAYIEETGESLSNYLAIFRQQRTTLLKHRGGLLSNHPDSVATTWLLAFENIKQANPAAIELIHLCAFLAPDAIPEELITEGASHLGPILQPTAANRTLLNGAIAELLKYSLIRRDPTTQTLTIHRLVQAVIKDEMDDSTQSQWAESVVRAVNQVFPFYERGPWPQSQRYLPHVLVCEELIIKWNMIFDEASRLLNSVGTYLWDRGQYEEAEPLYQNALTIMEKMYGRDSLDTEYIILNLANLYSNQGKFDLAEPLYQRALAIQEKVLGPDHPDTAQTLNNLANLYSDQDKFDLAEPLHQRAFAIREKVLGPDHPDTAQSLNNLAAFYYDQGKFDLAEPLYLRSLAIREKVLGPDHPDTALALNNLAAFYDDQGKFDLAEPLYQRALSIREKVLGPEHPDTVATRNNYALLRKKMEQTTETADQQDKDQQQ